VAGRRVMPPPGTGCGRRRTRTATPVEVAEDQNFLRVPMSFALFIWGTRSGAVIFFGFVCFVWKSINSKL
jgi:hypothetical protein